MVVKPSRGEVTLIHRPHGAVLYAISQGIWQKTVLNASGHQGINRHHAEILEERGPIPTSLAPEVTGEVPR